MRLLRRDFGAMRLNPPRNDEGHFMEFNLIPFPSDRLPKVSVTGEIHRADGQLLIRYELRGDLDNIIIPAPSTSPGRKDELWKTTCFEFFLAIKDQPGYWEFNMSLSGDWNIYRMDAYRRVGFGEETSMQRLPFEVQKACVEPSRNEERAFRLSAAIDLNPIFQRNQLLEVGITAIIQTKDGNETFWALAHPAPYADFHLRESFTLALAGETDLAQQPAPGD